MPGRLDPRPILSGAWEGLRQRRAKLPEPPDWSTRIILVALPLLAGGAIAVLGVTLNHADQLLAGTALLTGALLTGFAQIVSWRERVIRRHREVDASQLRTLSEAAVLILLGVVVSIVAAAIMIALSNISVSSLDSETVQRVAPTPLATLSPTGTAGAVPAAEVGIGGMVAVRILSSLAVATLTFVALSVLIVVNLLWDAFITEGAELNREQLKDFQGNDD